MAKLSKMRAKKKAWADWTPEKASGLPYGVPDNLELVGGIGKKTKADLANEGIMTLTALSMLPDEAIAGLEERTGIMKGRILREEWVEQARELLEGLPPRAKTDLPLWTRMQKQAAAAAPAPEPVGPPVSGTEAEPAPVEAVPVAAAAATMAAPESQDHIKIGILTAILAAITVMFILGWWFGRDERAASEAGIVCPPGQYPVMSEKMD